VEHFLSSWGYVALVVLTIAEAACVPIPSEVTVGFAGYLASTGRLDLALVIVLGTIGETAGALIGYAIGRFGGRPLVDRYGRVLLLTHSDLDRAEQWFDHKGEWTVLVGRVIPIVRTFIALPAGVANMQVVRFTVLTAIGSLVWVGALAGAGYGLGGQWHRLTHGFSVAGYILVVLAAAAIAALVVHRWRRVREERRVKDEHDLHVAQPAKEAEMASEGEAESRI
jgi:membrane protein DedA with SNARE-associated domain